MKLSEIVKVLGAEVVLNPRGVDPAVEVVCGSDLMSDVLAFSRPDALLLTGLATSQVIYTAEMADIKIICFIRGKRLQADTVALAAGKNIILLQTKMPMFESCGKLYAAGLGGCFQP
jgi:hypothetical protein